ncbi:DsbA family protein [Paraburkholderia acidisoli]|uniref:Thioredoxin domain-containing protein n=1 Tax=Paraburkholderia acidisoli TaxID=2571748 RepID=A0A7Z2GJQ3_9BURK|nr:DsbA family protein [Paraburkholderia acidisoli]QGZ63093.1 thioredoxin domain-containing protein [Paraburkholderia acidisoli]
MNTLSPPVGPHDHSEGPADAPLTLVEYGDFQCPYCGAMYEVVKSVQHALGKNLKFVFRQFPLTQLHEHALHAAEFAEAAAALGKFWQAHAMLFENQNSLGDRALADYATRLAIPTAALESAFAGEFDERIQRDFSGGLRSGVQGTPTLFINGRLYSGERDAKGLLDALLAVSEDSAR